MEDLVVSGGLVGEPCESPLGGELICQRRLLNKRGKGLFIEKTPPLHLRSNFDLDSLSGLYLGLDLIRFDL